MVYLVLVVLTILSCLLFEFSKLEATLKELTASYKEQFKIMGDKSLVDEAKQKALMQLVSKQLLLIGKLVLGILLFISPFLLLFILPKWNEDINPDILVTFWGLLIPVFTVILYILLKKMYARIFRNR